MPPRSVALAALLALLCAAPAAAARTGQQVTRVPMATNLAWDASGGLWVTSGAGGPVASDGVWYLPPGGRTARHVVRGLHTALGLTWHGGRLYVASARSRRLGQVTVLGGFDGTRFATRRRLLSLPIALHALDSIVPGPDGRLYLGVGSEFDARASLRRPSAAVVSFTPAGRDLRVVARGLRNPYGLAFVPGTTRLLVSDNGRDDLGAFRPPDELNVVETAGPARDYGFPRCFGQGGAPCRGTVTPLARMPSHAAAVGVAVDAAGRYAYVAQNGSSFSANPTGRDVQRVDLRTGRRTRWAGPFAQNDPLGAAFGPDRRLYVTLFASGRVVRYGLD